MANHSRHTDVAIIGAGPVGLFAVFECGMLGMRCHVFDALALPGGQCAALYPEKPIYDIPGYPRIDAGDLVARLTEQAAPFDPVYRLGRPVVRLEETAEGFVIADDGGTAVTAGAVVIAAGAGAFGPNRPPLAGIEEAFHDGISLIEWPDRLSGLLPARRLAIELLPGDSPDSRRARLEGGGDWPARLREAGLDG